MTGCPYCAPDELCALHTDDLHEDWPRHQPIAPDAPIPGRQWYGGCNPDGGHVSPAGVCSECGETACPTCGGGYYGPLKRGCQCSEAQVVANAATDAMTMLRTNQGGRAETAAAYAALAHGADSVAVLAAMRDEIETFMTKLLA